MMARLQPGAKLRVVGDVHGDSTAFAAACATERFVVQLGDLVDDGPDTPGALRLMFDRLDAGRGLFLLGNHDYKLARALRGDGVQVGEALAATIASLDPAMAARAVEEIGRAPAWLVAGRAVFVHGGFDPAMLFTNPRTMADKRDRLLARALFGQTTGRVTGMGKPERLLDWVDRIPEGMTVYCGHDQRSTNGRPLSLEGRAGGRAIMMDTGAGKGGHLSWLDIDLP
ncbi:MAG: phosphatase [Acidiphilium sp. 37-67-22]|nr:MAG: phosphatase [Acidiphilium sp. 21-66-27]OYW08913.1 MAG: phosphatase [Acidiphilium sp. 37-67-22]